VRVSAIDAARVNQYLAAGVVEFAGRNAKNDEELTLRLLGADKGERLELIHEPIGDLWLEYFLDETDLSERGNLITISSPRAEKVTVICEQAHMLLAAFGAFKSSTNTSV